MTKKKRSKESLQLSSVFRGRTKPLTKAEQQELLRQAVENTSLAHQLDEPKEEE